MQFIVQLFDYLMKMLFVYQLVSFTAAIGNMDRHSSLSFSFSSSFLGQPLIVVFRFPVTLLIAKFRFQLHRIFSNFLQLAVDFSSTSFLFHWVSLHLLWRLHKIMGLYFHQLFSWCFYLIVHFLFLLDLER